MVEAYKVFWQIKTTGRHGESNVPMAYSVARNLAECLNEQHPEIEHWVANASFSFEQANATRR